MAREKSIIIVGAGLAGSLMACYLAEFGYQVEIYERRSDLRKANISGGRSINLALSPRGIRPLEEIGIIDKVMKYAIPMKGRMIHDLDGNLKFQPYGKDDTEVINSVSRGGLNQMLIDLAEEYPNVKLNFKQRCVEFNTRSGDLLIHQSIDEKTDNLHKVSGDIVIGADGSNSVIRSSMQKIGRFDLSQQFLEHGYKELTILPNIDGSFKLEKNALHIWPRKSFMMIALPNYDGSFTVTLFIPFKGKHSFDNLQTEKSIDRFFKEQFGDVYDKIHNLTGEFFSNPTGNLATVKCSPWVSGNGILIGDAAHAVVPFYGQGMNASFEDCRIIVDLLKKFNHDWSKVFDEYNKSRPKDGYAIADLALDNFIEMRDRVADPHFLLMKQAEMKLYETYPDDIISKYSMVTFSHIPYSEAKKKGEILMSVISEMCEDLISIDDFNIELARDRVLKRYQQLNLED